MNSYLPPGRNIKSVGCSLTSIVLADENDVIAWGASPTYGELVSSIFQTEMKENLKYFSLSFAWIGHWRYAQIQCIANICEKFERDKSFASHNGLRTHTDDHEHWRWKNEWKIPSTARVQYGLDSQNYSFILTIISLLQSEYLKRRRKLRAKLRFKNSCEWEFPLIIFCGTKYFISWRLRLCKKI